MRSSPIYLRVNKSEKERVLSSNNRCIMLAVVLCIPCGDIVVRTYVSVLVYVREIHRGITILRREHRG